MKFGQGYIFTGVCDSVHRGGVWSRGGSPIFLERSPIFWGVSNFSGGLQFFRGVLQGGSPIFQGVSNFSGGSPIFGGSPNFFFSFFFNFFPKISSGMNQPPPPPRDGQCVRILLECILVDFFLSTTAKLKQRKYILVLQNSPNI